LKELIVFIVLCLTLLAGDDWFFYGISFADSDIEVIDTLSPDYEEDEPEPTEITQEMIDQEEELLEEKIREINETPVNEFGSLILKRKERSYYIRQLKLLRSSPENYFKTKSDK